MLLEFKTQNYKSFVEETTFSMLAAPKQKGLDYSLLKEKIKSKLVKGLCSSVVYGPNAAGKTNIIGAMEVFRAIILRGNIRNFDEEVSPNAATSALELIPNNKHTEPKPVEFSVDFFDNKLRIEYFIRLDLGVFLAGEHKRKILCETLLVNGEELFRRTDTLLVGNLKIIKGFLSDFARQTPNEAVEVAKKSLDEEELFLTSSFKLIFSPTLVKQIMHWFENKFMIIYRANSIELIRRFTDPQKMAVYVEKATDDAVKIFGVSSNKVGYIVNDKGNKAKLCSIFEDFKDKKSIAIAADFFESYGTIRFINIFPLIIRALQIGGTLVIDEFDASLHPMALMSIINVFHNNDINIHNAQLIFNTHNPIFLNSNLFRRDEIKFVEQNDATLHSEIYSLSDFGTTGKKGVRKHEDYMKNYFISQYGAIKDIDFTSVLTDIIKAEYEGDV